MNDRAVGRWSTGGRATIGLGRLPSCESIRIETPTPVIDALARLGVRHVDMPANGERVWRAIQDARTGA